MDTTHFLLIERVMREVLIRDPLRVGFLGSGPNSRYSEYLISDSPFRGLSIHLYGR